MPMQLIQNRSESLKYKHRSLAGTLMKQLIAYTEVSNIRNEYLSLVVICTFA
jgi:hypothetical protein